MYDVINGITAVAKKKKNEMLSDPERIFYDVSLFKCQAIKRNYF